MNVLYKRMTELLFEARDPNPRRISHPDHPSQSTAAVGAAGPGSQKRAEKRFRHIKNMKEVERKRATRAEKKAFKNHLLAIIRQDEARRLTDAELKGEAAEVVHGDPEGNWTYRRAKKAIRKAVAAGTFRLSKKQHKKLKGRGWSDKSKTRDLDTLRAKRVKQDRPGTLQSMKDMAKAVDAGKAPPAVATKHPKTGELTQHAGRTRHTSSKLLGGKGAEFAVISNADRHRVLKSKIRKAKREQQGGYTREPRKQAKNAPISGSRFDSYGFWKHSKTSPTPQGSKS